MTRVWAAALAVLCASACSAPPPAPVLKGPPPPLPEDVRKVASLAPAPEGAPAGKAPAASAPAAPEPSDANRLQFTGEFSSPMRSSLVARTQGRVGRVLVDEGQGVRAGQPLLEMETDYLKLDVARAEAEVARAQAGATEASHDFERKQVLLPKGSVSQATFDRAAAGAAQAAAARASAEASLALARQRLADAVLTSPFEGVVAERHADAGEFLGDGSVAFVLEQRAPLRLRFRVPERYLAQVRTGQKVTAHVDPYPDTPFTGKLTLVGQSVDPASRTFLAEADFANADHRLRPGLFARVDVELGAGPRE